MPERSMWIVERREMDTDWRPTDTVSDNPSSACKLMRMMQAMYEDDVYVYRVSEYRSLCNYD